jgi:hypothetical protein
MTLVAGRTLKLQRDNAELDIAIRVFAPEQEGTACSCRYEIDWPEGRQIMNAWGDDRGGYLLERLSQGRAAEIQLARQWLWVSRRPNAEKLACW